MSERLFTPVIVNLDRALLLRLWSEVKRDHLTMPDEHVAYEVAKLTGVPPETVLRETGHQVHD